MNGALPPPADGFAPPSSGPQGRDDGSVPPADGLAPPGDGFAPPGDGGSPADAQMDAFLPANGACGPNTCPFGCCDFSGQCIPRGAVDPNNCGIGGGACIACASNTTCQGGACVRAQPGCGPANCSDGCCLDSNTCSSGASPVACGVGGGSCAACDLAHGQTCNADAGCGVPPPPLCGAGCAGCCSGDFLFDQICAVGTQDIACGAGGVRCQNCTGLGARCAPGGFCR
ncbi:MAG: hypothetical protein JOZ69_13200 [Myxococcales bacterium]|nr:hypothetical protein [Myxococcales bacterium]